jgi:hypothetical protein
MDKDTLYFNIKNTHLQIFDIIIINLQLKTAVLSDARDAIFKKKYLTRFFLSGTFFLVKL